MLISTATFTIGARLFTVLTIDYVSDAYRASAVLNSIFRTILIFLSWQPCLLLNVLNHQLETMVKNLKTSVNFERGEISAKPSNGICVEVDDKYVTDIQPR